MVVWVHALYIIPGVAEQFNVPNFGGAGVDLFFIISGFIMVVTTAEKDVTPVGFFAADASSPRGTALLAGETCSR